MNGKRGRSTGRSKKEKEGESRRERHSFLGAFGRWDGSSQAGSVGPKCMAQPRWQAGCRLSFVLGVLDADWAERKMCFVQLSDMFGVCS